MTDIVTVSARNQRISPKKARLVMNLIRQKSVEQAGMQTKFLDKKAAKMITDLLNNAIEAAKNKDFKAEDLQISQAICNEGRKLKRNHPNARGRVNVFQKRMSHLRISLSEIKVDKNIEDKKLKRTKGAKSDVNLSSKNDGKEKNGSES